MGTLESRAERDAREEHEWQTARAASPSPRQIAARAALPRLEERVARLSSQVQRWEAYRDSMLAEAAAIELAGGANLGYREAIRLDELRGMADQVERGWRGDSGALGDLEAELRRRGEVPLPEQSCILDGRHGLHVTRQWLVDAFADLEALREQAAGLV